MIEFCTNISPPPPVAMTTQTSRKYKSKGLIVAQVLFVIDQIDIVQ